MDDVKLTDALLSRLEFLRTSTCVECPSRTDLMELDGRLLCWPHFKASVRRENDSKLVGHAPHISAPGPAPESERAKIRKKPDEPEPTGYSGRTSWYVK